MLQSNSVIASDWLVNRPVRLTVAAESDLAPAITAQWLADASLERIEWTPVAAFSRDLTEDKFPLQAASPFQHSASVKPNMEALRRITLPVNATKEQARDYVEAVMLASRNQTVYEIEDSQVRMLEKVGRPNLGVLIEFANRVGSPGQLTYLNAAIEGLASPEDAALILKGLNADPELVDLVIRYGWEGAARDILVSELENSVVLPVDWIKAVVSMRDPATYPALKAYLINGDNPEETFDLVKELPGLDLGDAIDEIWTAKRYASPYSVLKICALAAQYGHVDAIETAADILKKEDDPYDQNRARQVILKLTAATGDDKALVAWVESNRGKLVFDKASGKFWVGRR